MQIELHRHLDCSLRTSTLLRLAQERGLEGQSTSLDAFRKKLILIEQHEDLNAVLDKFSLFQKVLDRPEVLEQVAFEVAEDCWLEGTEQAELRFSPSFVSEYNGLSWSDSLLAIEEGIARAQKKYPKLKTGLICIGSRNFGPDEVDRTVEFYLDQQHRFIGVDLAGNEQQYPCRLFESSFKKAKAKNANITVHAGEGAGPENMWEAIELLGAKRIGHGIACVKDPQLMDYLKKHPVCLEMCPTSNWITCTTPTLEEHPLPHVLRQGVSVCISTDDPGIFGVTMQDEIQICLNRMGMTEAEIEQCHSNALAASFIPKTVN